MATRSFTLNTEPHEARIGSTVLYFRPESNGAEFAEAYVGLSDARKGVAKAEDGNVDPSALLAVNAALRTFLAKFMLAESVPVFEALDLPDRILVGLMEFVAELYSGNARGGSSPASA